MKYTLLCLLALVLLSSSSCYKVYCNYPPIDLQFQGFDSTQLASVVINKYRKDGTFQNIRSTQVYTSTRNIPALDVDYDYTVVIPATGQAYAIKGISFGNESTRAGDAAGCTRSATWYQDGQLKKYAGYYYADDYAVITIVM